MDEQPERVLKIAFVSPEAHPFSNTGGLGDVAGALPNALARLGHNVRVFTPYYRSARKVESAPEKVAGGVVPVGTELVPWELLRSKVGGPGERGVARQYLIRNDAYFDREGIYGNRQGDFQDAFGRYLFFSRAVLAAAEALGEPVEVYHCNDWQTALIPIYLKISFSEHPFHKSAVTLFTIHNLSYQGLFWHWDWPLLNLPWRHFNWKELEFHGKINLLKGAIKFADVLSTVSPEYAMEIQSPEHGCGLEGALTQRSEDLFGVVNGINSKVWDPATDPLLPARYSKAEPAGKERCRQLLLDRFELNASKEAPVVGMITKLNEEKGFKLVAQHIEALLQRDLRMVILGTGEDRYLRQLRALRDSYAGKFAVAFEYDPQLAHLIEAGSDIFLMPSRFEPCGKGQLYALRYGTLPLVHKVGGLADTVVDVTEDTLNKGTATGFVFEPFNGKALLATLDRALNIFRTESKVWRQVQAQGMNQDWSWEKNAKEHVNLYERALEKKSVDEG